MINWFRSQRAKGKKRYLKAHVPRKAVSLVSDDCFAGLLHSTFGLPSHSPFVLGGFTPREYVGFLEHMREPGALVARDFRWDESRGYPVADLPHGRFFAKHIPEVDVFRQRYERRYGLVRWDALRIKADFTREKYQPSDIEHWNRLRLENAVAFYPDTPEYRAMNIHGGVAIPRWHADATVMFRRVLPRFDVFRWLDEGVVGPPPRHWRIAYRLYFRAYAELLP